jgi:DNA-binding transcriptional ArsR family regulator
MSTGFCFRTWGMRPSTELERRIAGIVALDQPLRRNLYRLLSDRDGWTTRDEAAEALGIARSVAAFHLDKLAEAGVAEQASPPGPCLTSRSCRRRARHRTVAGGNAY